MNNIETIQWKSIYEKWNNINLVNFFCSFLIFAILSFSSHILNLWRHILSPVDSLFLGYSHANSFTYNNSQPIIFASKIVSYACVHHLILLLPLSTFIKDYLIRLINRFIKDILIISESFLLVIPAFSVIFLISPVISVVPVISIISIFPIISTSILLPTAILVSIASSIS